jgi:hypothetical protein
MNPSKLSHKLVRVARAKPPGDAVPFAFEQRIMARIRQGKPTDAWAVWSAALWRAAFACLAISVLSGALTVWVGSRDAGQNEFAQEFESALVASESQFDEAW